MSCLGRGLPLERDEYTSIRKVSRQLVHHKFHSRLHGGMTVCLHGWKGVHEDNNYSQ